ncbi:MAG: serine hydrolase domain-containing protein [Dysgonomonas sp.]
MRKIHFSLLLIAALNIWFVESVICQNKKKDKSIKVYTSKKNIETRATFDFPEIDRRIDSLKSKYSIPAITIAIIRNDKLVYINCYGEQDTEKHIPVKNSSLFRIASISKPITVVSLLKLMQEDKLSMDDEVFGSRSILGEDFGVLPENSNWDKITIRHLIEHKSGIHNVPNDPMFHYKGLTNKEIIERIIAERQLNSEPGAQNYYSNVGYNILGRVIEKVSGMQYEEYVKQNILKPCDINRMQIAHNTLEERLTDEVVYYQPDEPGWVYNMDINRMDAHGGWIASATDLARFITHVNRIDIAPDIINKSWLEQTYLGFEQWTHTGSLPGTATMLTRMNDEFSFVFLANRRSWSEDFWKDISACMQNSIKERQVWPNIDLFKKIKW